MPSEPEIIRTLAAIVMADVVNYGQLMGDDEPATVRTLQAYRQIFVRQIESRRGRVLDAKGDAIMAAFNSTVDAVAASVAIQKEIAEENEALPDNRRMHFRIGINLGDVVEEDDTLYGDGVNIAGRLESMADPGGVCISRGVHEQVAGKLPLEFDYLGEHKIKTETVRAHRILDEGSAPSGKRFIGRRTAFVFAAAASIAGLAAAGWGLYPWVFDLSTACALGRFPEREANSDGDEVLPGIDTLAVPEGEATPIRQVMESGEPLVPPDGQGQVILHLAVGLAGYAVPVG